ncbi:MAG TPA: condensation domain-containing protein, partial [Thermoanaerobaculia bacterium]
AAITLLPALPIAPSGKIDRRALAALAAEADRGGGDASGAAPRTPVEELIAGIWCEVLGRDRVSVRDSFFELGGHSLMATRVVSRLRGAFGVELPLRDLFAEPTIAGLALRVLAALKAGAGVAVPPLVPVPRDGDLPLSFAQQRLWFIDQLEPGSAVYNMAVALRIRGPLRPAVLAASLGEVVRRHEALRTVFVSVEGEPVQVIQAPAPFPLPVVDLAALPEPAREAAAVAVVTAETGRPFDLARGPLVRGVLLRLGDADHAATLTLHHIVSDGWSQGILVREVTTLYGDIVAGRPSSLPALPVQYADFAAWQRSWLHSETLAAELAYWRRQLAGLPPRLELPTDRPRPLVQSYRGSTRDAWLPPELNRDVQALSRAFGATPFMVLLAAFQALLSRTSGKRDLAVGSPIAGRNHTELEGLIGFFVNTLVLRADLSGTPSFRDHLLAVREASLAAHTHQEVPFEKLVEELAPERSLAHAPLFQVLFVLQNAPVGSLAIEGLELAPIGGGSGVAKFELTLGLDEHEGGLWASLEYNTDLFDAATVDRFAVRYARLLAAAIAEPERSLLDLPLYDAAERAELVAQGGDTDTPGRPELCLHELFSRVAWRAPRALAVVSGEQRLTYGELEGRANRLAWHLRSLGVGPERVVGISLERSPDFVVALLAALKAGGVYMPVDPALPAARRELMLRDAGAVALVTRRALAADLPEGAGGRRVLLDGDALASRTAGEGAAPPATGVSRKNLAYVIYTSGSPGVPKGVGVEHGDAAAHMQTVIERVGLGPGERFLQFAALGFDVAVEQFLATLLSGATLVLRSEELANPDRLLAALEQQAITVANLPTAYWVQLLGEWEAAHDASALPLRVMIAGGEAMLPGAVQRWVAVTDAMGLGRVRLLNAYGPTETVVTPMLTEVPRAGAVGVASVLLGRPMRFRSAHVLDERGELQAQGIAGELCLGGLLARGYLHRPEMTAERFVPDPFSPLPGARLSRTGDLARYL